MSLNDLITIGVGDILWGAVAFFAAVFFASYASRFRFTSGDELIVTRFSGSLKFMAARLAGLWKEFLSFGAVLLLVFGVTDGALFASIPLVATFEPIAWASLGLTSMGVLEVLGLADITLRDGVFMTFGIIAVAFLIHTALETLYEAYIE